MTGETPTDVNKVISDRITDLFKVYKVLNDSHVDTQIRLEKLSVDNEYLKKAQADDHEKLEKLEEEFTKFVTSFTTAVAIIKYIITPSVLISLFIQFGTWLANNR